MIRALGTAFFIFASFFAGTIANAATADATASSSASPSSVASISAPLQSAIASISAGPIATGTPTPTTSPVPVSNWVPSATPTAQSSPSTVPLAVPARSGGVSAWIFALLGLIGGAGLVGYFRSGVQAVIPEDDRCGNIKELLEQKKRELEDYTRSLPQQKAQEFVVEKGVAILGRDERLARVLATVQGAKETYDKLTATIELLQKKFDLCSLGVPSAGGPHYEGTIVDNSLTDVDVLKSLTVHQSRAVDDWNLHDVSASEGQIQKMGEFLREGAWYMHFWNKETDDMIVVFKDRTFRMKQTDKRTWTDAVRYGVSKGIPAGQLDFGARQ